MKQTYRPNNIIVPNFVLLHVKQNVLISSGKKSRNFGFLYILHLQGIYFVISLNWIWQIGQCKWWFCFCEEFTTILSLAVMEQVWIIVWWNFSILLFCFVDQGYHFAFRSLPSLKWSNIMMSAVVIFWDHGPMPYGSG